MEGCINMPNYLWIITSMIDYTFYVLCIMFGYMLGRWWKKRKE